MPDKVYGQHCGLAKALDLVGERWTLLIIRELFFGARRYIETASLVARLKYHSGCRRLAGCWN